MRNEGLIILGANGSLGSYFCKRTENLFETRILFDKIHNNSDNILGCDLSVESDVDLAVKMIPIESRPIWRLVIATGIYDGSDQETISWEKTLNSIQINLLGTAQFVILFAEAVRALSKTARIVIISSAAAWVGSFDTGYGISKAGLNGLIRSVSKRYAQHGITALGVAPGFFPSAMSANQSIGRKKLALDQGHLGRETTLDEVATCLHFALFDAPEALSGTFISPNGGQVF